MTQAAGLEPGSPAYYMVRCVNMLRHSTPLVFKLLNCSQQLCAHRAAKPALMTCYTDSKRTESYTSRALHSCNAAKQSIFFQLLGFVQFIGYCCQSALICWNSFLRTRCKPHNTDVRLHDHSFSIGTFSCSDDCSVVTIPVCIFATRNSELAFFLVI